MSILLTFHYLIGRSPLPPRNALNLSLWSRHEAHLAFDRRADPDIPERMRAGACAVNAQAG